MQHGIEQDRADVQRQHREACPDEGPVPAEEALLTRRAEQPRAHPKPEPDGERQERERDEAGRAGDDPGNGHPSSGRNHAATSIR